MEAKRKDYVWRFKKKGFKNHDICIKNKQILWFPQNFYIEIIAKWMKIN